MKAKRALCMLAAILLVVAMMLSWRFPMVQSSAGKLKAGKTMMTAIRFR